MFATKLLAHAKACATDVLEDPETSTNLTIESERQFTENTEIESQEEITETVEREDEGMNKSM